jgi:hypothetical protein
MVWIFGSAVGASLLRLTCPRCGEVQARARKLSREPYDCRRCHERFTREEGEGKKPRPRKRR